MSLLVWDERDCSDLQKIQVYFVLFLAVPRFYQLVEQLSRTPQAIATGPNTRHSLLVVRRWTCADSGWHFLILKRKRQILFNFYFPIHLTCQRSKENLSPALFRVMQWVNPRNLPEKHLYNRKTPTSSSVGKYTSTSVPNRRLRGHVLAAPNSIRDRSGQTEGVLKILDWSSCVYYNI